MNGGFIAQDSGNLFSSGPILSGIFSPLTLQTQLEPLFAMQKMLSESFATLNSTLSPLVTSIDYSNSLLSPMGASIQSLGTSLFEMSKIAADTGVLFKTPSYDFIKEPLLSTLGSVAHSIQINQDKLFSYVPKAEHGLSQINLSVPNYISQINSLGNLTLDYLKSSPTLFPLAIESEESELDTLKKKVENLESRVDKLENENRNLLLTNITDEVSGRLEKIDPNLAKYFRGAIATLTANQSEDLVGQVAESLTRVITDLPFALDPSVIISSTNKKERITEALGCYLKIPKKEFNSHHLILQQKSYYDTLGNIRHRERSAYKMYNADKTLFKAFVIQIEAYIYILITFKSA